MQVALAAAAFAQNKDSTGTIHSGMEVRFFLCLSPSLKSRIRLQKRLKQNIVTEYQRNIYHVTMQIPLAFSMFSLLLISRNNSYSYIQKSDMKIP